MEGNPKLEMDEIMLRFPHLMEQVLQKLDDKGLLKSREAARSLQEFIDAQQYPWLRIVNIPTILRSGSCHFDRAQITNLLSNFEYLLLLCFLTMAAF